MFRLLFLSLLCAFLAIADTEVEPNNSCATANTLSTILTTSNGSLQNDGGPYADVYDYFSFNSSFTGTLNLSFAGASNKSTTLTLYNSDCSTIISTVTGTGTLSLTPTVTNGQTYKIKLQANDNGNYSYTFSGSTTALINPVADYRMDDCSWSGISGEVLDSSTHYLNGTTYNGASLFATGSICKSGSFSGNSSNSRIEIPDNSLLDFSNNFSISVWINPSSYPTSDYSTVLAKNNNYKININPSGYVYFYTANGSITSTSKVNLNTWTHIVVTYANGSQNIYINGVAKGTGTLTGNIATNTNPLIIGSDYNYPSRTFNGMIDEVELYSSVLSQTLVTSHYNYENSDLNYDGTPRVCSSCTPSLTTCYSDDFNSTVLSNYWKILTAQNYIPNISSGTLNLTQYGTGNIADGINLNGIMPASNNYIQIVFQDYAYGSSGTGADGVAVVLSDGNVTPIPGANGGSLGYAQKTGISGFAGGWLGFGLDEYGNYSNPTEGRNGGTGFFPNAVAIRGSAQSSYPYITGTGTLNPGISTGNSTKGPGYWYRFSIDTRFGQTMVQVERSTNIATPTYSTLIPWTNATQTATSPSGFTLSLTGSTGSFTNTNSFDNFSLSAVACGTAGWQIPPANPTYSFDAFDATRSLSDRNISLQLVNTNFDLQVAALNQTGTAYQDFNGTVCIRPIDQSGNALAAWNKLSYTTSPLTTFSRYQTSTFNIPVAIGGSSSAKMQIRWLPNIASSSVNCTSISGYSEANSTDTFSVRPTTFAITAPTPTTASTFTMTTSVVGGGKYIGNATIATQLANSNPSCYTQSGFFNGPASLAFLNDSNSTSFTAIDVGDINISVTDNTWSAIDSSAGCIIGSSSNTPTNGLYGCNIYGLKTITVTPDHFDLNATYTNFNGGTFTYLSTDLNMSSQMMISGISRNSLGLTTKNFDKNCYAQDSNLSIVHSTVPSGLNNIIYADTSNNISGQTAKANTVIVTYPKSVFSTGVLLSTLLINMDRNESIPVSPFYFNTSALSLTSLSGASGSINPSTNIGGATFYYGRIYAKNITSNNRSATNNISIEIFDNKNDSYIAGMPQEILHWYRNIFHTYSSEGNIIKGAFIAGGNDSNVIPSSSITNGIVPITITSSSNQTVHLDVNSWLWSSYPKYYGAYNYTTDCLHHVCFNYTFSNSGTTVNGVSTGTFSGSDFNSIPASNIIKTGVKIFR